MLPDLPECLDEFCMCQERDAVCLRKIIRVFNSSMAFGCVKVLTRTLIREHQVWKSVVRGPFLKYAVRYQDLFGKTALFMTISEFQNHGRRLIRLSE